MLIGQSIRKFRAGKKVTQSDLAKWLGVSRQAVSMWESEKRELKVNTLRKIARVFGVGVDDILKMSHIKEDKVDNKEENMPRPAKKKTIANKIQFQFNAPEAKRVALTGDFKKWASSGVPMRKAKDGTWKIGVELQPGRYEYKFIVDSEWRHDPNNTNTIPNTAGSLNSIIEV